MGEAGEAALVKWNMKSVCVGQESPGFPMGEAGRQLF